MLQQYFTLKKEWSDGILFFRMGDFYEVFGVHAETIAPLLNIVLTSREKGLNKMPFCGVPHHSAQSYWMKLLKLNFKVGVAEQVEDAAEAEGLVKREIVKIITPGCCVEDDALELDRSNYIMAYYEEPHSREKIVSLLDVSTGEWRIGLIENLEILRSLVFEREPRELLSRRFTQPALKELLREYLHEKPLTFSHIDETALQASDKNNQKQFQNRFGTSEPWSLSKGSLVLGILAYLDTLKYDTAALIRLQPLYDSKEFALGETAIRDLEIFETSRRKKKEGSLYHHINQTLTPMGARLLRYTLCHPVCDD